MKSPANRPYFYSLGLTAHDPFAPILKAWNQVGDPAVKELLPVDYYGTYTNVYGNGSGNIHLPDTPPDDSCFNT